MVHGYLCITKLRHIVNERTPTRGLTKKQKKVYAKQMPACQPTQMCNEITIEANGITSNDSW